MKHDLALPAPGTEEPKGKPSKTVRLGEKPVLPPPPKPLDEAAVDKAIKAKSNAPVTDAKPIVAAAPAPNFAVEREPLPPPQPMAREKSRSASGVFLAVKPKPKKPRPAAASMDDEVAVVAIDPRRPRH